MCDIKPLMFKRGSTFAFMLEIPAEVPDGFFSNWLPTAQLRKARIDGPSGLIATLDCYWNDEAKSRHIIVRHELTGEWQIGNAEMDIRLSSVNGEHIQTATQPIVIQRSVTR